MSARPRILKVRAPDPTRKGPPVEELCALIQCPGCGVVNWIDDDHFHGRVPIECGYCEYFEMHDLSTESSRR